ncbi:hypothetical protein [Nonomuraea sp. B19D2]|uniref:hypothetical protein n=1 Tax=Nonomuraea sp. B19D2 TaxID=3159561 RepID=UPI0032DA9123
MPTTRAAVLAGGVANTAKLFVAALAFAGAYVGASAHDSAGTAPGQVETVTLSAREVPCTEQLALADVERSAVLNRPKAHRPSRTTVPR